MAEYHAKTNFKQSQKYEPLGGAIEPMDDGAAFDQLPAETTTMESLGAAFDLSRMDTTTRALAQHAEISQAENEGGEQIPAATLNEMYQDIDTPFTEPRTAKVAEIIAGRQRQRQELSRMVQMGPQGSLYGIARFGAAMIPHAADPANLAATVAIGALTEGIGLLAAPAEAVVGARGAIAGIEGAAAATEMAGSARIAYQSNMAMKSAGVLKQVFANPTVRHIGEGIAGNSIGELAVSRASAQEGRPYSGEDAIYNVVGGAIMIPGLGLGFEKARLGIRYTGEFALGRTAEYLHRLDPKYTELIHQTSLGRLLREKLPVPEIFHEQSIRELQGLMPEWSNAGEYRYAHIMEGERNRLFAATYDRGDFHTAQHEPFDQFLGNAAYVSDDPRVANGAAGRGFKEGTGRVLEAKPIGDLNLIHLDEKAPPEIADVLKEHGIADSDIKNSTMMEIMHKMQDENHANAGDPEFLDKFNQALKERGYDGYHSDGTNVEGIERPPHNSLVIFNQDKLEQVAEHAPEVDKVGNIDPEKIQKLQEEAQSEVSQLVHNDPQAQSERIQQLINEPPKPPKLVEMEQREQELTDDIKSLEKQELLSEAEKKAAMEISDAKADAEVIAQTMKDAAACMGFD
jgi:hypothetical protein